MIQHLTLDEVLAIHERVIEVFGGSPGISDPGLLESALYRPRTGYYNDLSEMAAALFESLIMNHPFVDGNKRVAFFSTDVFLRMNGYKLKMTAEQANDFITGSIERRECDYEHILNWIRMGSKYNA